MRRLPLPFLLLLAVFPAHPLRAQAPMPPDPFQSHVRAGEAAARSGLPLLAAREYRAAVALHPADAAAHYALAGVLEQGGRADEALAEYEATVRLDPADAAAHNALGMLLEDRGRRDAALAQYRQAVALSPSDARLHFNLAAALEAAGQGTSARAEYQAALRLDPTLAEARAALQEPLPARLGSPPSPKRRGLGLGGWSGGRIVLTAPFPVKAAEQPRKPLVPLPAPNPPLRGVASLSEPGGSPYALEAAGRLPEAVWAFHTLLVRYPDDAPARLHLGIALCALGRTGEARRQWGAGRGGAGWGRGPPGAAASGTVSLSGRWGRGNNADGGVVQTGKQCSTDPAHPAPTFKKATHHENHV